MATVTTSITPSVLRRDFTTPATLAPYGGPAPIAQLEVNHVGSTTGVGAGDDEDLFINIDLTAGYFYRILDLTLNMNGTLGSLDGWSAGGKIEMRGADPKKTTSTAVCGLQPWLLNNDTTNAQNIALINSTENLLQYLPASYEHLGQTIDGTATGTAGVTPRIRVLLHNPDASQVSVSVTVFARLLQYTFEQGSSHPLYGLGNTLT